MPHPDNLSEASTTICQKRVSGFCSCEGCPVEDIEGAGEFVLLTALEFVLFFHMHTSILYSILLTYTHKTTVNIIFQGMTTRLLMEWHAEGMQDCAKWYEEQTGLTGDE